MGVGVFLDSSMRVDTKSHRWANQTKTTRLLDDLGAMVDVAAFLDESLRLLEVSRHEPVGGRVQPARGLLRRRPEPLHLFPNLDFGIRKIKQRGTNKEDVGHGVNFSLIVSRI